MMGADMQRPDVVILCGGRGTRLAPDTDVIPKPLVNVGGRPILWHIMSHYARHGYKRFILCLGYRGEMIRDFFLNYDAYNNDATLHLNNGKPSLELHGENTLDWTITFVDTGIETQTGGRLRRVRDHVASSSFHCTYGDGVSD